MVKVLKYIKYSLFINHTNSLIWYKVGVTIDLGQLGIHFKNHITIVSLDNFKIKRSRV